MNKLVLAMVKTDKEGFVEEWINMPTKEEWENRNKKKSERLNSDDIMWILACIVAPSLPIIAMIAVFITLLIK